MDDRDRQRLDMLVGFGNGFVAWGLRAPDAEDVAKWFDNAMRWQDELIGLTGRVDPEFCALLRPLEDRFEEMGAVLFAYDDRKHRFNVSAINTQVRMVEKWLEGK